MKLLNIPKIYLNTAIFNGILCGIIADDWSYRINWIFAYGLIAALHGSYYTFRTSSVKGLLASWKNYSLKAKIAAVTAGISLTVVNFLKLSAVTSIIVLITMFIKTLIT